MVGQRSMKHCFNPPQNIPKYCISHFWGRQHILNVWTLHDPNPHFSLSKFPTMPFRILVSAFMAPGGPPWGMTLWCCLLDDAETQFLDIFGWFMNKISMPWNPKLNIAQLLKQWALWRFNASQLATLWSGIKVFILISVASCGISLKPEGNSALWHFNVSWFILHTLLQLHLTIHWWI